MKKATAATINNKWTTVALGGQEGSFQWGYYLEMEINGNNENQDQFRNAKLNQDKCIWTHS